MVSQKKTIILFSVMRELIYEMYNPTFFARRLSIQRGPIQMSSCQKVSYIPGFRL